MRKEKGKSNRFKVGRAKRGKNNKKQLRKTQRMKTVLDLLKKSWIDHGIFEMELKECTPLLICHEQTWCPSNLISSKQSSLLPKQVTKTGDCHSPKQIANAKIGSSETQTPEIPGCTPGTQMAETGKKVPTCTVGRICQEATLSSVNKVNSYSINCSPTTKCHRLQKHTSKLNKSSFPSHST